jgi:putative NIF3 family GTP cyclohydrolase 1 type 2
LYLSNGIAIFSHFTYFCVFARTHAQFFSTLSLLLGQKSALTLQAMLDLFDRPFKEATDGLLKRNDRVTAKQITRVPDYASFLRQFCNSLHGFKEDHVIRISKGSDGSIVARSKQFAESAIFLPAEGVQIIRADNVKILNGNGFVHQASPLPIALLPDKALMKTVHLLESCGGYAYNDTVLPWWLQYLNGNKQRVNACAKCRELSAIRETSKAKERDTPDVATVKRRRLTAVNKQIAEHIRAAHPQVPITLPARGPGPEEVIYIDVEDPDSRSREWTHKFHSKVTKQTVTFQETHMSALSKGPKKGAQQAGSVQGKRKMTMSELIEQKKREAGAQGAAAAAQTKRKMTMSELIEQKKREAGAQGAAAAAQTKPKMTMSGLIEQKKAQCKAATAQEASPKKAMVQKRRKILHNIAILRADAGDDAPFWMARLLATKTKTLHVWWYEPVVEHGKDGKVTDYFEASYKPSYGITDDIPFEDVVDKKTLWLSGTDRVREHDEAVTLTASTIAELKAVIGNC